MGAIKATLFGAGVKAPAPHAGAAEAPAAAPIAAVNSAEAALLARWRAGSGGGAAAAAAPTPSMLPRRVMLSPSSPALLAPLRSGGGGGGGGDPGALGEVEPDTRNTPPHLRFSASARAARR